MDRRTFVKTVPALAMMAGASSVSLSSDGGHTWSEPRFVFANALGEVKKNPWFDYNCSYIDGFADGEDLHLFVPHRWQRAIHLHLKEADLRRLPTMAELKGTPGSQARDVKPDEVVPLWPGDGLPHSSVTRASA